MTKWTYSLIAYRPVPEIQGVNKNSWINSQI